MVMKSIKGVFVKLFTMVLLFVLSTSSLSAFSFNVWHSGMTLEHAGYIRSIRGGCGCTEKIKAKLCHDVRGEYIHCQEEVENEIERLISDCSAFQAKKGIA